jgi:hypothetical protein
MPMRYAERVLATRGGIVRAAEKAGRDSIANERAGRSAHLILPNKETCRVPTTDCLKHGQN